MHGDSMFSIAALEFIDKKRGSPYKPPQRELYLSASMVRPPLQPHNKAENDGYYRPAMLRTAVDVDAMRVFCAAAAEGAALDCSGAAPAKEAEKRSSESSTAKKKEREFAEK